MIIITKIETIEVDRDMYPMPRYDERPLIRYEDGYAEKVDAMYYMDLIKGKRFVKWPGGEYVVGWSKQVEELLGVPLELIDDLQKDYDNVRDQNDDYLARIRNFNNLGFWKRLWFILNEEKI